MNSKTLLGLGAIGGAIYLATSKKAQAKVKKTTGLSDNSPFKYELKGYDEDGLIVISSVQRTKSESDKKKKEYLKRNDVKKVIQKKFKSGLSDGGGKTFKNSLKAYSHIKSIVDSNTKSHYEMGSGVYYTGGKIYLDKRIAKYRGITSGTESKYLLLNPNSKDVIKYLAKELKDDGVLIEEKISKSQMNDYRY